MNWMEAVKSWRSEGGKGIPKKGTDDYNKIKSLMGKAAVPVGEGGKGPKLMETSGGLKTPKGIEPEKKVVKKRVNKLTHHPTGRKIRSDKGVKRVAKAKESENTVVAEPEVKKKPIKKQEALVAPEESVKVPGKTPAKKI